jgi:hypothetical protein
MDKGKEDGPRLGAWAFIIGLIIAIIVSIVSAASTPVWAIIVLAILGIIVGFMNVTEKEAQPFLLAAIGFLISFNAMGFVFNTLADKIGWGGISTFFNLVTIFMAPAAIIVAVKMLFKITKD